MALLNLGLPGRMKLSTGVPVLYADDESFTLMTPAGRMLAGWITSAESLARHFGVAEPRVDSQVVCVDRRRPWSKAGNLARNPAVRTFVWTLGTPVRWLRRPAAEP